MVTKREVLEELALSDLQKIADRLRVRVSKGLSGLLTQAMLGPVSESKRPYIEALASSDLVTIEEIDRILHTRYSRLPDDMRGVSRPSKPRGVLSDIFLPRRADSGAERFFSVDSLVRHILDSYVTKSDLLKICQSLGLAGTGNKGDLVARIICDTRMTKEIALYYLNRDDMRKLCQDLKLPATGTRREMENRVVSVMMRLPRAPIGAPTYEPLQYDRPMTMAPAIPAYAPPPGQPSMRQSCTSTTLAPVADEPSNQPAVGEPPIQPPEDSISTPSPTPGVPGSLVSSIPVRSGFDSVVEFIDKWRPTKPYKDEEKYQIELFSKLCSKFGDEYVM